MTRACPVPIFRPLTNVSPNLFRLAIPPLPAPTGRLKVESTEHHERHRRIFLVLNLILSALFVGWAANALSTSEEYKKQFDDEVAAHATTTSEAEASANDLRAELSTAKTRASVLQDESNDFENNATRLQGELDAAIARADSLGSDVSAIGSSVSDLNNTLGAVEAAKDNAVADAAQAKKEAGDAVDAKMAADSARIDAEDALDSANATIAALEVSLASSNASNSRLEATLATAVEEYGIPLSEITAQPDIRSTGSQCEEVW